MPVIAHSLRLVYFDVPKVGCTTLKTLLWEMENNRPFPGTDAPLLHKRLISKLGLSRPPIPGIHHVEGYRTWSWKRAQTCDIPADYTRITILRDPAARLYSAWSNKGVESVFALRREFEDLHNECVPTAPDFGAYLDHFETYRRVSRPVRVHTEPYSWHLGPSVHSYDRVFRLEDMESLEVFLSERAGREVRIPRHNSSREVPRTAPLTDRQIARLVALCAEDYAWCDFHYDPVKGIDQVLTKTGNSPTVLAETMSGA